MADSNLIDSPYQHNNSLDEQDLNLIGTLPFDLETKWDLMERIKN